MRKLLTIKLHDSEFLMYVQCNIISLIGHLQDIITFFIARYRQMKMLKELLDLELLSRKEHKMVV